jgi:mRNA interferase YafQ
VRQIVQTAQFKKDLKKVALSGRHQTGELFEIVTRLAKDEPLVEKNRDHALAGNWRHHRECHIRSDWLLIYKVAPELLMLVRTGSHGELFE